VLNLDETDSRIYVYDLIKDIRAKKTTATKLTFFGSYTPYLNRQLNISSFEVAKTDELYYRMLFITSITDFVISIGVYAENYTIIVDKMGREAVNIINVVDTLQIYH
jgi:hypothetical protein